MICNFEGIIEPVICYNEEDIKSLISWYYKEYFYMDVDYFKIDFNINKVYFKTIESWEEKDVKSYEENWYNEDLNLIKVKILIRNETKNTNPSKGI